MNITYNEETALSFVNFSNAVYCFDGQTNNATEWDCVSCLKACPDCTVNYFVNQSQEAAGYVAASDDLLVVAFRGSEYIKNWINDADYWLVPRYCDGCMVHGGFLKSWQSLKDEVVVAVQKQHQTHPNAKVHVTGHSLGAAMGVIAATDITQELGIKVDSMFTFGLPRVGNREFRAYFQTLLPEHFRITHWRDPVPHLPPVSFNFWHVGTEVFYNEPSTNHTVCDGSGEDPLCSDQFYVSLYISDHSTYIRTPMDCV